LYFYSLFISFAVICARRIFKLDVMWRYDFYTLKISASENFICWHTKASLSISFLSVHLESILAPVHFVFSSCF
jgi:hypothetical protein